MNRQISLAAMVMPELSDPCIMKNCTLEYEHDGVHEYDKDHMEKITEAELDDMDFGDVLSAYRDQKRMRSFEGESGLKKLNELCNGLGYREHGLKYGSSLEVFLVGNPGACDAIIEWMYDSNVDEWRENLIEVLDIEYEDE